MSELRLSNAWVRAGRVHLRGALHDARGAVVGVDALAARLAEVRDLDGLTRALDGLDGFFALVIELDDGAVLAAVDRTRSLPLFHRRVGGGFVLSDAAHGLVDDVHPRTFDPRAVDEFLFTSYVTGRRTLHPAVDQLQAGEAVELRDQALTPVWSRYYRYGFTGTVRDDDEASLLGTLDRLTVAAVERMLGHLGDRPLAIPLSGGRDSRLLALTLVRLGYGDRVVTFTYGKPGNAEAVVSRQVADGLGLPWHFVEYDEARWANWVSTPEWRAFCDMADGLTSVPHLMDWPATGALVESGVLTPDTVVVPGHSADLPAGSRSLYVPDVYRDGCRDVSRLVRAIVNYHYCLFDDPARLARLLPGVRADVEAVVEGLGGLDRLDSVGRAFESWDWQERQARLIVNSVRAYEFWGLDWWLPWWDRPFVDFWASVPMRHKRDKVLYDRYVDGLARQMGLELAPTATVRLAGLRTALRRTVRRNPRSFAAARSVVRAWRRRRWERLYASHPMGWYGMVPPEVFAHHFTGRESILAYMALERVGRLRFVSRSADEAGAR